MKKRIDCIHVCSKTRIEKKLIDMLHKSMMSRSHFGAWNDPRENFLVVVEITKTAITCSIRK